MPQIDDLEILLSTDIAPIQAKKQGDWAALFPEKIDTLILFGAGPLGRETAQRLKNAKTGFTIFFSDNNPQAPTEIDGIPVLPPQEAFARYKDTAVFVTTIYNPGGVTEQLRQAGCKNVTSYITLYYGFPDALMPLCSLDQPAAIFDESEAVRAAFALWADDESRQEFIDILGWYVSESYHTLPRRHPQSDIYFAPDLVKPHADERYVDCGAFDGDSIREFITRWNQQFAAVAAFEPIEENFAKLTAYHDNLTSDVKEKISLYPYALGAKVERLPFSVAGISSSMVSGPQQVTIDCKVMDELLGDFHPTFIKMDIEGAEPEALRGAHHILKNDAPLLAICLYHDIRHLWQIPLQIHHANPDYKLYLRRYAQDCWETLCYAIHPSR